MEGARARRAGDWLHCRGNKDVPWQVVIVLVVVLVLDFRLFFNDAEDDGIGNQSRASFISMAVGQG